MQLNGILFSPTPNKSIPNLKKTRKIIYIWKKYENTLLDCMFHAIHCNNNFDNFCLFIVIYLQFA